MDCFAENHSKAKQVQITVPERYRKTLLYHGHWPTLFEQPETRKMYNVLKETKYLPYMAYSVLNPWPSASLADGTGRHESTNDAYSCSQTVEFWNLSSLTS